LGRSWYCGTFLRHSKELMITIKKLVSKSRRSAIVAGVESQDAVLEGLNIDANKGFAVPIA
jgi:hypothetical protein